MPQQKIRDLINKSSNPKLMGEVFAFAKEAYGDKKRASQESYLEHAVNVAAILQEMDLDQTTVMAGLLHDVADTSSLSRDKKVSLTEIESRFGMEIASLVQKSAELKRVYYSFHTGAENTSISEQTAQNIRKMFFAIAKDTRVILIDLASRIDGLEHIGNLPAEAQKAYAQETLQIFVPIANRLSLGEVRRRLEDLAFEFLDPKTCLWLKENLSHQHQERQQYLASFLPHFKKVLQAENIRFFDVHYRAKSYWSTYQKLKRHQMDFEKLYDLVALRLVVSDVGDCYRTLGILHKHYPPISGQIQDYIAKPKENGYQSLHTTVYLEPGIMCEIQIKTQDMHQEAEHGIYAHWAYKEGITLLHRPAKIDFYPNHIFAFTPKGDVVVLPKDSTPIDFAYALHSDIGNHCESAKIDGKIIPLNQPLQNGDIVEIITNKKRKPSYDWVRFVKTNFAKSHIKKLITSIPVSLFSVPQFVKDKIVQLSEKTKRKKEARAKTKKEKTPQIYIAGHKQIAVTVAKCCSPKDQDAIQAYLPKYRAAAVVHHISCANFKTLAQKFPEKIINATWEES